MIRIGRCKYDKTGKRIDPTYPGFTPIIVLMKSHSKYGVMGPYLLVNKTGQIMENIWQFSKIYQEVPAITQHYSRYNNLVIWQHQKEKHLSEDGILLPAYWKWRTKGMNNKYPVRYPVGFYHRKKCLFCII